MKHLFVLAVTIKLILLVIIFLAFNLLPFNEQMQNGNFLANKNEKISLQSSFKTWDAQHYLFLIQNGYAPEQNSNKFFPLYPTIVNGMNYFIDNSFIAALLVSNIFSLLTIAMCFLFVKEQFGKDVAILTGTILLLFPTAFYLSLIYTESVFMFLVFSFFYFLFKKNYVIAGAFSFFMPFTRPVGILILIPFVTYYLLDNSKKRKEITVPSFNEPVSLSLPYQWIFLLFPLLGFCAYLFFMQATTGNYFSGFTTETAFIGGYRVENVLSPSVFLDLFFTKQLAVHNYLYSSIDRILFFLYLCLLPFIYKYAGKTLYMYSLAFGMLPLLGSFMGYSRYIFVVFPLFIVLAIFFTKERYSFLKLPFFLISFSLQVLFMILHSLNYWVS